MAEMERLDVEKYTSDRQNMEGTVIIFEAPPPRPFTRAESRKLPLRLLRAMAVHGTLPTEPVILAEGFPNQPVKAEKVRDLEGKMRNPDALPDLIEYNAVYNL